MNKKIKVMLVLTICPFFFVSCATHSKSFDFGKYSEAEQLFAKGEYEKAIGSYQDYIAKNPEGNLAIIAEYYIAKSYQSLGDEAEARKYYQKIADNHPDIVWANFSKSRLNELESGKNS